MTSNSKIKAPYHIAFIGALLGVLESGLDFFLYDVYIESSVFQIGEEVWLVQTSIGLLVSMSIAGYLYYHHRSDELSKDSFLYVIVAAVLGLIIGGKLSTIIILIGSIICYRRL